MDATAQVIKRCHELGFALAGVCEARPTDHPTQYLGWLEEGRHGEMEYLARHTAMRIDPGKMVVGARSVICVADRYHAEGSEGSRHHGAEHGRRGFGRIARYARGGDYHKVIKKRLQMLCDELRADHPEHTFRACVDTAPVLERDHAERAGLGTMGKHTLLIEQGVGSYMLLGEIITTLRLAPSHPAGPDPCGPCTRCIDACPTDAITPWSVDATRCISYLTIEHRGEIDEELQAKMGDWIFGCDICQEVCPHNQRTRRTARAEVHSAYEVKRTGFDLLEVLGWSEEDRRAAFSGSSLKRAKLDMMKRNAAIALGNHASSADDPVVQAELMKLAQDRGSSEAVRQAAAAAIGRSSQKNNGGL